MLGKGLPFNPLKIMFNQSHTISQSASAFPLELPFLVANNLLKWYLFYLQLFDYSPSYMLSSFQLNLLFHLNKWVDKRSLCTNTDIHCHPLSTKQIIRKKIQIWLHHAFLSFFYFVVRLLYPGKNNNTDGWKEIIMGLFCKHKQHEFFK